MVDLHIHTKYSLLDANIEPEELVKKVKEQKKSALCVTEHGNLYSSIEVYKACQKHGVKYLMGCEAYICNDVFEKNKDNRYNHLILIAKNETGRLNLIKLVSLSNKYKYYGKPRIDYKMLLQHKDGIVVLSACMAGEIQRALEGEFYQLAKDIALKYKTDFGNDYYLEYQSHTDELQQSLNRKIVDLANELNIQYVLTTDAHYISKDMQKYHNIFVQIGQSREVGETYNDCYVQTEEEVFDICKSTTEEENRIALANTERIAQKCNVTIPLSAPIMPHNVKVPNEFSNEIDYVKHLCMLGWKDRNFDKLSKNEKLPYKQRLQYEINAIQKMGFEGYYLLVWDYVNSVKRRGIARGSGGGSLVAYLMNIVDTDPVKYGLYFERFIDVGALDLLAQGKITKEQLKIPDFDSDFGKEDRNKVLGYVINKYTQERVASLGSFQYMWAKGAIKDIGKVLDIPFEITNEMTSALNDETIQEALDLGLLDKYMDDYPELFEYATYLAGLPKSFSVHPCGKVISMNPIEYYNAVDVNEKGEVVLQGDMHTAEDLGLIKADLLGLRTVDIIYDTLEMIGRDYNYIAPHNINFEDKEVLNNFKSGNTSGIFQFESDGMKGTLKSIECSSLYDLTVANALYRPGSMAFISNYANRKNGSEEYEFLHEDLKSILSDSFAIIVFQEQLIEIGRLAGLSNPDELRQATAKKKPELMNKIKPELFEGLKDRGWNDEQLEELWDMMLDFAKYSFNKSHALAYAMIAYICMYLKTHHPKEFVCAWINSFNGKTEKLPECIREAKRLGITVYPSQFNNCKMKTLLYLDGVILGTESIKYCNAEIANELMELSKNKYTSFTDLVEDINTKTSVNSRQLTILTGLNFFEEFGHNKYLFNIIEVYNKFNGKKQINKKDLDKLGLTEYLMKKYSLKETPALYKALDIKGLINELCTKVDNKPMSVTEQVKFELEYLEYTTYMNPDVSKKFYIVLDFKVYSDKTKPYLLLRNIRTGDEMKTKIKRGQLFVENSFAQFSILKIGESGFENQFKTKNIGGKWQKTDEVEAILVNWEVVK